MPVCLLTILGAFVPACYFVPTSMCSSACPAEPNLTVRLCLRTFVPISTCLRIGLERHPDPALPSAVPPPNEPGSNTGLWEKYAVGKSNVSPHGTGMILGGIDQRLVHEFNQSLAQQWKVYDHAVNLFQQRYESILQYLDLLFLAPSCLALPCLALPCLGLPCLVLPCLALPLSLIHI